MQQPDNWLIINAIASAVSSLAALTAVIVAVKAFYQAREDHKADAKSHRPRFHPSIANVERESDGVWSLESSFYNQSANSASAVSAEVSIYASQFRRREFHHEIQPSQDIHSTYGVHLELKRFAFAHPNEDYYFVYRLTFQDANTGEDYQEMFYLSGRPPTDDTESTTHLEVVHRDVKYRIEQGVRQFAPVDNSPRRIQ